MTLPNQEGFIRILRALRPYLDELVIVGAWGQRLMRFAPAAAPPTFTPLMSEDMDVATPEKLLPHATSIGEALGAAGFTSTLAGSGPVPASRFYPDDDAHGLYLEFIAPLRGGGRTRKGDDDVLRISGVTASKLRYVELLLFEPWGVQFEGLGVRIPNPASYLAQKVLTLDRRQNPTKKPKDALYIHDTLTMFGDVLAELRPLAVRVLEQLPRRTQRTFRQQIVELFRDETLMIQAADIAAATGRASPPSPTTLAAVCTIGLAELFGLEVTAGS